MRPTTYTIPLTTTLGRLSIMAKPIAGEWLEDSIQGLKQLQIDKVISLLEPYEQYELGLSKQSEYCQSHGLEYLNFPIADRGLPSTIKAVSLAKQLSAEIEAGKHVAIHCRAGIGRTGVMAGAVLVAAGVNPKTALQMISQARG
ncbi:MAG TPA: tyrosine-protein phosphatase, partial [Thiolinea sp.]|nr:tyrosine-protein phosphatase [Thiolinea sp.]